MCFPVRATIEPRHYVTVYICIHLCIVNNASAKHNNMSNISCHIETLFFFFFFFALGKLDAEVAQVFLKIVVTNLSCVVLIT